MVEYTLQIDSVFGSLADPIRRDILRRVDEAEMTVNQIAASYDVSLAAVSKHIKILLEAGLVHKRKKGRYQLVSARPETMRDAAEYMMQFEQIWTERLDALDEYLKEGHNGQDHRYQKTRN